MLNRNVDFKAKVKHGLIKKNSLFLVREKFVASGRILAGWVYSLCSCWVPHRLPVGQREGWMDGRNVVKLAQLPQDYHHSEVSVLLPCI